MFAVNFMWKTASARRPENISNEQHTPDAATTTATCYMYDDKGGCGGDGDCFHLITH